MAQELALPMMFGVKPRYKAWIGRLVWIKERKTVTLFIGADEEPR